jgi:predicted TPR repeat methyltransferase
MALVLSEEPLRARLLSAYAVTLLPVMEESIDGFVSLDMLERLGALKSRLASAPDHGGGRVAASIEQMEDDEVQSILRELVELGLDILGTP